MPDPDLIRRGILRGQMWVQPTTKSHAEVSETSLHYRPFSCVNTLQTNLNSEEKNVKSREGGNPPRPPSVTKGAVAPLAVQPLSIYMPELLHSGKASDGDATQDHAMPVQVCDAVTEVCGRGRAVPGAGLWQRYGRIVAGAGACETFTLNLTTTLAAIRKGAGVKVTEGQVKSSKPNQEGKSKT